MELAGKSGPVSIVETSRAAQAELIKKELLYK